jgi:hypothetical protein
MGEAEVLVAGASCARSVPATVPAQAAAQASTLSLIGLRLTQCGRPHVPGYFVFWDEMVGRLRIHRADCGVSKYGQEMHELLINRGGASTFDWPADTYAKACEIAAGVKRRKAFEKSVQTDCDLCHPERQW